MLLPHSNDSVPDNPRLLTSLHIVPTHHPTVVPRPPANHVQPFHINISLELLVAVAQVCTVWPGVWQCGTLASSSSPNTTPTTKRLYSFSLFLTQSLSFFLLNFCISLARKSSKTSLSLVIPSFPPVTQARTLLSLFLSFLYRSLSMFPSSYIISLPFIIPFTLSTLLLFLFYSKFLFTKDLRGQWNGGEHWGHAQFTTSSQILPSLYYWR